ncbi:MAG TPA: ABC transporter substrate-binding protein [Ideonella sp.]|nr:ABC transporter substrate-binding protein [Ideonella sp.]
MHLDPLPRRAWLARVAASLLAGTGIARAAAPRTAITVGYTANADFGAAFIAKERGYFEQRGLDVKLQLIALSSTIPAALVSESMEIGGTTPPLVMQAVQGGLDLVCLASGATYSAALKQFQVMARTGAGIRGPQDLVGRKVAVPGFNATLHLLVRRWLARNGVDWKQVSFVEVPLMQSPTVLAGGTVDAMATIEPFVTRIVQAGSGTPMAGFVESSPDGAATVLWAATRKWATSHGAQVAAFRQSLAEAVAFANSNRAAALEDIAKYFKLPPEARAAVPFPVLQSGIEDRHLRFWVDTMRDQGMLTAQPVVSSLLLR